jgi:(E)-4-hydroxy-3-methylbut-2-enyl-diphosphate synthase
MLMQIENHSGVVFITINDMNDELLDIIKADKFAVLILKTDNEHAMADQRRIVIELMNRKIDTPIILTGDIQVLMMKI